MKVLDNLENYEVPSQFKLNLEEEERFAEAIAEIVPELEKRVKSKLQTRKYFKQHLRYTSNVNDYLSKPDTPEDKYEFGESYVPYEDEYTWNSDLLQNALLSILSVERLKYGYIINLIEEDIYDRAIPPKRFPNYVPDNLIKFVQEFDIDSMREEAQKIPDIRKRIVFYRTKITDLRISDLLSPSEMQDWGPEYEDKIDALIKLEEKKLELFPEGEPTRQEIVPQEPSDTHSDKIYIKAMGYEFNSEFVYHQLFQLMMRVTDNPSTVIDGTIISESFEIIDNEYDKFLMDTDLYEEDRIEIKFLCIDHWQEIMVLFLDSIYSDAQKKLLSVPRNEKDKESNRIKDQKAHNLLMFFIQRVIFLAAGYKAGVLYNHRYQHEVFYNINGWGFQDLLLLREQYRGKIGGGKERDMLFDRDSNIEAFYENVLEMVRDALLEVAHESESMPEDERLETYKDKLRALFEFDLQTYLGLVEQKEDITTIKFHEVESWIETTLYCIHRVCIEAEMYVATDELLSSQINYGLFIETTLTVLQDLQQEIIAEHKSITGDPHIDSKLNDLGEIDADETEIDIPDFNSSLIGANFITEDDLFKDANQDETPYGKTFVSEITGHEIKVPSVEEAVKAIGKKQQEKEGNAYMLLEGKEQELKDYLNAHLDRGTPTKAIALLYAAKELGYTSKLKFAEAEELFGTFAKQSTFTAYYNGRRSFDKTILQSYKTALINKFGATNSSDE